MEVNLQHLYYSDNSLKKQLKKGKESLFFFIPLMHLSHRN